MPIADNWQRYPDAREVIARYPGTCLGCKSRVAVGDTIVGTTHDGWVCTTCSESVGPVAEPTPWSLHVNARSRRLKFAESCCHCGSKISAGSEAWPNALGGWACPQCKNSVPPTWSGVVAKAAKRIREGVPIALTLDDYTALSTQLKERTTLIPTQRGDQAAWSEVRRHILETTLSLGWQMSHLRDAFGLVEDGIKHRFNPNLSTAQFLQLTRYLEDPTGADPEWVELFRKRRLRPPPRI